MRSTIIAMSLCLGAVAAGKGVEAAPPSKPTAAPIRVFGNWAVACDNGLRCEAVSLQPKESQYAGIGLVVTRDSGPTAQPSVTIGHILDGHHGDADVAVDNRIIVRGMLDKSETVAVPSAQVSPLIRALVTGKRLRLTGGGEVSDTSLDGASAAFRYMDAQQGRADTVTALVATGGKPASLVPTGLIPIVRAIKPPTTGAAISAATRASVWAKAGCKGPAGDDQKIATSLLSDDTTLVLVTCYSLAEGGENPSADPYLVQGDRIEKATFDAPAGIGERGSPPSITSGFWDSKAGTLTSFERGRALADCASQETFVWDGARFRLVAHDEMDVCRGAQRLVSVWRARAVFDGRADLNTPVTNRLINTNGVEATNAAPSATQPSRFSLDLFITDHLHVAHYELARADLNGARHPEALVYADDRSDCGSGGCDLYVLSEDSGAWRIVSDISITRPPIRLLPTTSHGWHDLSVFVAGGGILPGHDVRLIFDGNTYPGNPTIAPARTISHPDGKVLIATGE